MRPPPEPQQIREAAHAFSAKTTAADGWHPRIFQHLSDQQLRPLCAIFQAWEFVGCPALPVTQLMVKMLPKANLEYRPIGLFPTPFRLWGKTTAKRPPHVDEAART